MPCGQPPPLRLGLQVVCYESDIAEKKRNSLQRSAAELNVQMSARGGNEKRRRRRWSPKSTTLDPQIIEKTIKNQSKIVQKSIKNRSQT